MSYRMDEKGKIFTTRVSKQGIRVTARIGDSLIQGTVYLTLDNRLKDELNNGEEFIAITDAEIWAPGGAQPLYTAEVLIVNKQQIVWILPRESSAPTADAARPGSSE